MGLHDRIRQEAKIDSRRFGKSVMCDIIQGTSHKKLLVEGKILPQGFVLLEQYEGAFDPIVNMLFVMPRNKYEDFIKIEKNLSSGLNQPATEEQQAATDVDAAKNIVDVNAKLIKFLKQNTILVKMPDTDETKYVPKDPRYWGVVVDSVDVGTAVHGFYSKKTALNVREPRDARD